MGLYMDGIKNVDAAMMHRLVMVRKDLKKLGLDELLVFIKFKDGSVLSLSTHLAMKNSQSLLHRAARQFGFACHTLGGQGYDGERGDFIQYLKNKFNINHVINFTRVCAECDFFIIGLAENTITHSGRIRLRLTHQLEDICINFLLYYKQTILKYKPEYKHALVLLSPNCLARVIKRGGAGDTQLTTSERECLTYMMAGKTAKDTAVAMDVREDTIHKRHRSIKEKMSSETLIEAAFLAFYLGEVGCVSPMTGETRLSITGWKDSSNITTVSY